MSEMDPKLIDGVLVFDCPSARGHRIRIRVHAEAPCWIDGEHYWQMSGAFPDALTLNPSVNEPDCWHGSVSDGAITWSESGLRAFLVGQHPNAEQRPGAGG